MKNILSEEKKIKLQNKRHSVKNETEIFAAFLESAVNFLPA